MSVNRTFRQKCRNCLGDTNHLHLYETSVTTPYEYSEQEREQYGDYHHHRSTFNLVQCLGCEDVRLISNSEQEYHGHVYRSCNIYPPDQVRRQPDWIISELRETFQLTAEPKKFPTDSKFLGDLRDILSEIYVALGGGSYRLAMMGIRALVEQIMVHECGDKKSFTENIKAFFEKGHIAVSQQEMFKKALIEAGHATMHRGWKPNYQDVSTLLDIVETLIKTLYIDSGKAMKIAEKIPPPPWTPR